jgi:antitoxin (DNA-binding transcriptional repressor) of toxin-antitoxin stability system
VAVQPLVVLPGWWVEQGKGNFNVKAMNAAYLAGFLRREDEKLEAGQARRIIAASLIFLAAPKSDEGWRIWPFFQRQKRPCQSAGVRYNERMKTLTITEGRGRLGYWLKKAAQGEDVGFVVEGKIVALRPVEVVSTDYALQEYGLTPEEMAAAEKRIGAELKAARKRGELTPFTGSKDDFR